MVSGDDINGSAYIFGTLAVASAAKYAFGAYTRWQKLQRFELVGRVSALNVFPVKSCGGISVQRALSSRLGLRVQGVTDRHWMVTRPNGDFLSQRQAPKMSLLKVSFHGDQVFVDGPGMPTLKLPINPTVVPSLVKKCRVWEWRTEGLDCGQEAADWMCSFMGQEGLRVLFSAPGLRKRESSEEIKPWGNPALLGDQSAYSDFGAYMLLSEESLNFLNSNLNKKVTMRNFRPNIVVSTNAAAFDEDNWHEIKIGDKAYMRMLDPCTRCTMTTVNGDLGEKSKDGEPLETLKRLRCFPAYGAAPIFGVNCAVDVEGTINVGDPVYALRK
ncbi:mitochondrial amidoxime-reducing component 1-like [Haliotis rubra]|uniref:mitochondrial amidoxime-reducing component 1-like n=1 Tax=Haliotis rubra TaxID=36100 RepID=UPI001EE5AA57|nr:mitochondrial amidoxime-reducing component 1-like [Haliotis rubra]